MLWLYRFLTGYIETEISGDVAETAINLCAKNGITLWNVKRRDKKLRAKMTVRDLRFMPSVLKKSGIRIHILNKYGFPFVAARYKRRWGIPVGAIIFFCFLEIMSHFIWTVEVNGNGNVPAYVITEACAEMGIREGTPKSAIDPQSAKQKLLLKLDSLAWASFNIEGCRLTVDVTEAIQKAEDNSVPTNLKASHDGVITKIDITSGNCVVKVGDTVGKGDLLVSGAIERENSTRFVHSSGSITARIEKEIKVEAYYEQEITVRTEKTRRKSVLSVFGIKIPLFLGKENYEYESSLKVKQAEFYGQKLPLRLYTGYFEETGRKTVKYTEKELKNQLETLLKEAAEVENLSDFEVKNREYDEINGGICLKALVSAESDIAAPEILLFNAGN